MKKVKVIWVLIAVVFIVLCAFMLNRSMAQETPVSSPEQQAVAPAKAPESTLQELQWQAAFIGERMKNLQYEFQQLQEQQKKLQDEIVKRTPKVEKPKVPEKK